MRRREFIFLALQGGWLAHANAQSRDSSQPLIAVLSAGSESSTRSYLQAFRDSMSRLGYVEGRAARFEYRFADGYLDRLPKLAAELVLLNPTVIVSAPLPANLAVAKLTSTIPIVMSSGADPVGNGLVKSLSHPGGNVTGVANFADELPSKQVEVLKELFPNARRLGILLNLSNRLHEPQAQAAKAAAAQARVELIAFPVQRVDDLASSFTALTNAGLQALLIPPDTSFLAAREQITELTARARLPACYGFREHVQTGGLMSYGVDLASIYARSAFYVDRILKGAKPAELPVEQPTKFELVLNLKTAQALGLTIPPTLLARADEVIE